MEHDKLILKFLWKNKKPNNGQDYIENNNKE